MAFEFDFEVMYRHCCGYIAKGLRIVRLHGIWPDGTCTCGHPEHAVGRSGERSCGKHPIGDNWGQRWARTEDDILAWDDGIPFNVGVILGPDGGYIDNEDDTPEGRAFRHALGLDNLETPSWTSGRSTHQLTKWSPALDGCGGKAEPGGLECRLGAGGRQMQSVLPPSWHWSGVQYQWKPSLSLDEVDVAETPRELLIQIQNYSSGRSGVAARYQGPLVFREVHDGEGRHKTLLLWAWNKIVNDRFPLAPERRAVLTKEIQDANEKYIVPPKTPAEVLQIINSCFEHYRRRHDEDGWTPSPADVTETAIRDEAEKVAADDQTTAVAVTGYGAHGLEVYRVGEVEAYRPGSWKIQMIQSDPPEVILCVPAWEKTACRGRILMSLDTFRSAPKVAAAVFLATRRVILDGDTARWHAAWKGRDASRRTGGQSVPGLAEQLIARKAAEDDISVGTSSLRYAQLAGYVLQKLAKARAAPEERPEPAESGNARWVTPDELWFQWSKLWEEIGRSHDVQAGERNRLRARLLEMMGCDDFVHRRHRFAASRMEYVVFTRDWLNALDNLASGLDGEFPLKGGNEGGNRKKAKHKPSTVHSTQVVAE